jgi:hypothetical protein
MKLEFMEVIELQVFAASCSQINGKGIWARVTIGGNSDEENGNISFVYLHIPENNVNSYLFTIFDCHIVVVFLKKKVYSVVIFKNSSGCDDEDSVEVVPSSWLTPNKSHCQWPPFKGASKIAKAIKSLVQSDASWPVFNAKCLKECSE